MFEKEAEERAKRLEEKQTLGVYDNDEDLARDEGFNDGEVCGYEQGFQEGAEFGYNKANEWNYPSKGKYPKDEKKVLVQLKDVEEPILDYYRQDGLWNYALENEVIAWKEIVLPELKEIE